MIPTFAVLYCALGEGSFYQGTLSSETRVVDADLQALREAINRDIDSYFSEYPNRSTDDESVVDSCPNARVTDATLTELSKRFQEERVDGWMTFHAECSEGPNTFAMPVELSITEATILDPRDGGTYTSPMNALNITSSVNKDQLIWDTFSAKTGGLPLDERTREAFNQLSRLNDPLAASDRFPRMLYFSTITITTLGYGDITPVNSQARAFVAFEALSGVVVIGLFISSIANPIVVKGGRDKRQHAGR